MNLPLTLLCFSALLGAPVFAAEKIAVESGKGIHRSQGNDAAFVRYLDDLQIPNLSQQGFYEISLGTWSSEYRNSALGLALGLRGRWNNFHLDGGIGVAYIERKTHLSDTHQQFVSRLGAGYIVGNFDFALVVTHYSNAKPIFGWVGKNVGYDFLTFQVGYVLK